MTCAPPYAPTSPENEGKPFMRTIKSFVKRAGRTTTGQAKAFEEFGPKVLLPYQARTVSLLESSACRVLFVEKSRRVGLTWGLAAYAVLRAGREKSAGGMDAMYISYSQEMTREFIDACAMWARAFNMAATAATCGQQQSRRQNHTPLHSFHLQPRHTDHDRPPLYRRSPDGNMNKAKSRTRSIGIG